MPHNFATTASGQDLPVWRWRPHGRWTPERCRTCAEPRTGSSCHDRTFDLGRIGRRPTQSVGPWPPQGGQL